MILVFAEEQACFLTYRCNRTIAQLSFLLFPELPKHTFRTARSLGWILVHKVVGVATVSATDPDGESIFGQTKVTQELFQASVVSIGKCAAVTLHYRPISSSFGVPHSSFVENIRFHQKGCLCSASCACSFISVCLSSASRTCSFMSVCPKMRLTG